MPIQASAKCQFSRRLNASSSVGHMPVQLSAIRQLSERPEVVGTPDAPMLRADPGRRQRLSRRTGVSAIDDDVFVGMQADAAQVAPEHPGDERPA
jgi:hypothetical protein